MAHLDRLKISSRVIPPSKRRRRVETMEYRRQKLVANIEEQIELVTLALEGKELELARKRGHQVKMVRPRLWWREEGDGQIVTQIIYNKIPLNLAGQGTSIEVGSLKKLRSAYRIVIKAANAGELDQAIESAARKTNRIR